MKYVVTLISLLFILQQPSAQKTKKLFNEKNLKGWYAFCPEMGKLPNASDLFQVDKGTIRLYGQKAGYLMSKKSFDNFKLTAQFRWNTDTSFIRKNSKMNSGLMYLVPKETPDTLWPKGIQFQIKEGATGDFILLQHVTIQKDGKTTEPGRSVVIKGNENAENKTGDWNTLIVTCKNGHIEQFLNEKLVNEGTQPSVKKGRILLQYEGFPIDFKNLTLEKL